MKFKIIANIAILGLSLIAGCNSNETNDGLRYFHNNKSLDEQDKAFATRLYKFVISDKAQGLIDAMPEDNIDSELFETDIYKKWGFGRESNFSDHEKRYLAALEIVELWEDYKDFDVAKVDPDDSKFIQELHSNYGEGPVDVRKYLLDEASTPEEADLSLAYIAELLYGDRRVDDRTVLFIIDVARGIYTYGL